MNADNLPKMWEVAQEDLGIEIVAPFDLIVSSDVALKATLRVVNFGGENGMLVFDDYVVVEPYIEKISSLGFGFSIMSQLDSNAPYDRNSAIEMLSEWEWTGDDKQKPSWILA